MHRSGRPLGRGARRAVAVLAALASAGLGLAAGPPSAAATPSPAPTTTPSPRPAPGATLHLVTLRGPGLAGAAARGAVGRLDTLRLWSEQDRTLARVQAPAPVYRWTTALNGYAARLTPRQARDLAADPAVALVERNSIRPLAARRAAAAPAAERPAAGLPVARAHGGAGVVIGVVDSGLDPEGPLFARTPQIGRRATDFAGTCQPGEGDDLCNGKVVGARWYVAGFGADDVRAVASLSALDDDGHGTQVASIAAGNARVDVRVGNQRLGRFSGVAPQARLAVYKACWTAPDPRDDGCATADLVTAIDDATHDGVDVLNLSVGGPPRVDTVDLALLGAAEADVVVTAAAGNDTGSVAHPEPWVTTVGGTLGAQPRGVVVLPGAADVAGAMVASRPVGPARLVLAAEARTAGATRAAARVCTPGSLDAALVGGRIVVCDRGEVGRVDKSAAVALADGVGMVLANVRRGSTDADFHRVPTVHLDRDAGRAVKQWLARHPDGRATLRPAGLERVSRRVAGFSGTGDPARGVVKPDVVAPAVGVLGAVPPSTGARWDFVTGTSAATAYASGAAAVVRARHDDWSATEVRSALTTSARVLRDAPATRAGAGSVDPDLALRPGLVHPLDPARYRAWWADRDVDLNTPSVVVRRGAATATRTVTNTGGRALYFSSRARGFDGRVLVTPAALRLDPGESATYTVQVLRRSPRADDGVVVWRGATGTVTRVPVVIR